VFSADGRTDGQTVMTKLIFILQNFGNTPKNCKFNLHEKKSLIASVFNSAVREDLWGIEIDAMYSTFLIWAAANFAFGPLRSQASASQ